jgi:hypothetical protein
MGPTAPHVSGPGWARGVPPWHATSAEATGAPPARARRGRGTGERRNRPVVHQWRRRGHRWDRASAAVRLVPEGWSEVGRRRAGVKLSGARLRRARGESVRGGLRACFRQRSNGAATWVRTAPLDGPNDDGNRRTEPNRGGQSTGSWRARLRRRAKRAESRGGGEDAHSACRRQSGLGEEPVQTGRRRRSTAGRRRGQRRIGTGEPPESNRRRRPTQSTETSSLDTPVTRAEGEGHAYSTAAPMVALGRVGNGGGGGSGRDGSVARVWGIEGKPGGVAL